MQKRFKSLLVDQWNDRRSNEDIISTKIKTLITKNKSYENELNNQKNSINELYTLNIKQKTELDDNLNKFNQ